MAAGDLRGVVALDGPSGTGKSTVARRLAGLLGARYLDTGSMYRAVTLAVLRAGVDPADEARVIPIAEAIDLRVGTDPATPTVHLCDEDVAREIRGGPVTRAVSAVSAIPRVRELLVAGQRAIIELELDRAAGIVVEGRDIGTVVAPDAALKIFLTASSGARALRRARQDAAEGRMSTVDEARRDVDRRDRLDSSRLASPLRAAEDAVPVDTTELDLTGVLDRLVAIVDERGLRGLAAGSGREAVGGGGGTASRERPKYAARRVVTMAPALPDGALPWLHDFARWVGTWLYRPAYRIRIHGRTRIPATGPVVLVANHSSFVEPQMLFGLVGRRAVFLVKAELAVGVLGLLLRWLGQLHVRRGVPDREPLMAAVQFLRDGGLVGVFPEGRRGSGDVLQAEQGAAWLVRTTGAVVLPVATRGTSRPPGSGRRFRPEVDVLIGSPFTVSVQRGRSGLAAGTEEIRALLADLVREVDKLRVERET